MKENYELLKFENAKFKILHIEEETEFQRPLYSVFGIATTNNTTNRKFIQSFELVRQEGEKSSYVKRSMFMYKDWKLDFIDEAGENIIRKKKDYKSLGEMVDDTYEGKMSREEFASMLDELVEMKDAGKKLELFPKNHLSNHVSYNPT